jgi:hypothetical protein
MSDDLILNPAYTPGLEEITAYLDAPARKLWLEMADFLKENYQAAPKVTYSRCSGKPGWNVKYQKSGKSLCTLYPEKERFIALVVVTMDLVAFLESALSEFEPVVVDLLRSCKPFNGTLWLMIPVDNSAVLEDVQQLLDYKHPRRKNKKS